MSNLVLGSNNNNNTNVTGNGMLVTNSDNVNNMQSSSQQLSHIQSQQQQQQTQQQILIQNGHYSGQASSYNATLLTGTTNSINNSNLTNNGRENVINTNEFDFLGLNDSINIEKNLLNLGMFDFQSNMPNNAHHSNNNNNQTFAHNVQIIEQNSIGSQQPQNDLNEEYWYHNLGNHQYVQISAQQLQQHQQQQQQQQHQITNNGGLQMHDGSKNVVIMMPPPSFPKSSTPNMSSTACLNTTQQQQQQQINTSASSSSSSSSCSSSASSSATPSSSSSSSSPPASSNPLILSQPPNGKQSKKQANSSNGSNKNANASNAKKARKGSHQSKQSESDLNLESSLSQGKHGLTIQSPTSSSSSPSVFMNESSLYLLSPSHTQPQPPTPSSSASSSSCSSLSSSINHSHPNGAPNNTNNNDPNSPKPPLTGYQHYFKLRQSELRSQDPSLKFGDIVKIVGHEWSKNIDQDLKNTFINKGIVDKERYKSELNLYKQTNGSTNIEPGSPNSSPNGKQHKLTKQNSVTAKSPRQQSIKMEVENIKMEIDITESNEKSQLYCGVCEVTFMNSMQKSEHLNSQQHFTQSKLKEAMLKLPSHHLHHQNSVLSRPNSALPQDPPTTTTMSNQTSDCCLLSHREYFSVDSYHGKILERSLHSSGELKFMRQKLQQLKTDNRKFNANLKTSKQDLENKQLAFNELCKANNYFIEQLSLFKRFIQLCQTTTTTATTVLQPPPPQQQQQQTQQPQTQQSINVIYINDQQQQPQQPQQNQLANNQQQTNNYINQCFFINQTSSHQTNNQSIQSNPPLNDQSLYQQNQQYYHQPQYVGYITQQQQQQQPQTTQQYQQVQSNSIYVNDQYSNYMIQNGGGYISQQNSNVRQSTGSLFTYDDANIIQQQQQQQQYQYSNQQQHQLINPNLISVPNTIQQQQQQSPSSTPVVTNTLANSNSLSTAITSS